MKPMFSPFLMRMDLLRIREQTQVLNLHADFYHIGIMGGYFVKNTILSLDFVKAIARASRISLDCHLIITHPDDYITMLTQVGAISLSPYAETISTDAFRILHKIHEFGCRIGTVLNSATPPSYIQHYLYLSGKITTMSVDPGFVGQTFIREMLDKVKETKTFKLRHGYRYLIEMDGSRNATTFQELRQTGVEVFIMGNPDLSQLDDNLHVVWEKMFAQLHGEIDKAQYLREQL